MNSQWFRIGDGFSNVRKSPKLSGETVGKVNHGQIVWVSGSGDKDWFAVTYHNDKGIRRQYSTKKPEADLSAFRLS